MWIDFRRVTPQHEVYLESVGRALAVSQHLESTSRYVLIVVEMGRAASGGDADLDALRAISERLRNKLLGHVVDHLGQLGEITYDELEVLDQGREARNYIAHEAASAVSEVPEASAELSDRISRFVTEIQALASADNLVSAWSYEIQEKEPRPSRIWATYATHTRDWIVEPLRETGFAV